MARKKDDYNLKLQQLVQYILQDGHEKAEEIDVLAEEEYYIERNSYMSQRLEAVKKYYDNLEKKFQQQMVLDISKTKNQAFRDVLGARNVTLQDVLTQVGLRMSQLTNDQNVCLYKKILYQLIIQGLVKIMEPDVIVEVRKKDVQIVKKVLKQAQEYFSGKTGMMTELSVNEDSFLPASTNGGVLMYTRTKSISINNTLDTKLDQVSGKMMPFVRKVLFGANPNRKHLD